jgi:SAM-dependent methyltransferase
MHLRRMIRRLLPRSSIHQYDTYERLRLAADALGGENRTVLDVGGLRGQLQRFIPAGTRVYAVNVTFDGDMVADGHSLPNPDGSVDAVCCLDVLEHLPRANREQFTCECRRVARKVVVVVVPLWSEQHAEHEHRLFCDGEQDEDSRRFLEEHVRFGLPTLDELLALFPGADACFAGSFTDTSTVSGSRISQLLSNWRNNERRYRRSVHSVARPTTNRVCLVWRRS